MSLRIRDNGDAMGVGHMIARSSRDLAQATERLSSGRRVNRAADDAAGLSVAMRLRAQAHGAEQARRNATDAISLLQTAEGALGEVHQMLQRVRDLAVSYASTTLSADDRAAIQSEVAELGSEIERIGSGTSWGGIQPLAGAWTTTTTTSTSGGNGNGNSGGHGNSGGSTTTTTTTSPPAPVDFLVGATDGLTISVATISLGALIGPSALTFEGSGADISEVDAAIDAVSAQRGAYGAVENRLGSTVLRLDAEQGALESAESRVRDADMAAEAVAATRAQLVRASGIQMLQQANLRSRRVLDLLAPPPPADRDRSEDAQRAPRLSAMALTTAS